MSGAANMSFRPRLLDLFCGAGGAAMGYHRAGFEVVDIKSQPNYPFEHVEADALEFLTNNGAFAAWLQLDSFDAVHASPPCQHYSKATKWRGKASDHPDLVPAVRERLGRLGLPWVMENVREAFLKNPVMLCGTWFGLRVQRHRYFESGGGFELPHHFAACDHRDTLTFEHKQERAYGDAMGCEWMPRDGHREAVPPAYTEWIGRHLLTARMRPPFVPVAKQFSLSGPRRLS